jgi:hypothetical protein
VIYSDLAGGNFHFREASRESSSRRSRDGFVRRIFRRRRTRRYVTSQDANRPKYAPCRRSCLDGPGLRLDVGGRSALLVGATRFNGQRPTSVARGYQSNSSFEPSVAAVIIAGMPIAAAASAKIRASIIIFPVILPACFGASDPESSGTILPINIYRAPVSAVLRRQNFWFRVLWPKHGQRFTVCGRNSTQALRVGARRSRGLLCAA